MEFTAGAGLGEDVLEADVVNILKTSIQASGPVVEGVALTATGSFSVHCIWESLIGNE